VLNVGQLWGVFEKRGDREYAGLFTLFISAILNPASDVALNGRNMPQLGMEFLGLFQVSLDGKPLLTFESNKVRALLAYLSTEAQRPHPRESLATLLWPDWPDRASLSNLRYALSDLRKVIGDRTASPPYLLINRESIQFNQASEHTLDVAKFTTLARGQDPEPLAQAITLYQGEFLEGFSVGDAEPFDSWARLKREHFHRAFMRTLYQMAAILGARGEDERALPYARRLVEVEPLDESAQRQLMVLLARNGRSAEALAQYLTCREMLNKELGARPSQETEELYLSLLKGESPPSVPLPAEQIHLIASSYNPKDRICPNNLPVQLTSFIGREREMGEIKKLLASTHLLTLTGVGGTGKTRLALQVSADLIDEFPGGVWLVELAPLRDPKLVEHTVASTLRVPDVPDHSLSDLLVEYVRDKHLLLLLDNCEHVSEACAQLAGFLLGHVPKLKILATSRTRLNQSGEVIYQVLPLALPSPKQTAPPHILAQFEALRLFIDRVTAVQPSFVMTNENALAVTRICTHLDGIPLAIELAAARTRHLSPDQISARLADRFNLLTGGSLSALPRQQTLRAAMDWSYDLLGPAERTLFNRLAVFPGSFSLEAAEAICTDESGKASKAAGINKPDVLDLLGALVDHSLVSVRENNCENRYYLLETVRQYALEKLHAGGELPTLQDRHLAYYLELAEQGLHYVDIGHPTWMQRFETEYDNLRDAMEYAIATHPESAIRLENPLSWFCDFTSRNKESHDWAMRLLDLTEPWPPGNMRATALWEAGNNAAMIEDFQQAQEFMDAGLEMAKGFGDKNLIKDILHDLAALKYFQKNGEQLRIYTEQFLAISRELGDKKGIVTGISFLGVALYFNGDKEAGRNYIEQALEMARQENFPYHIAGTLGFLAKQALLEGDITRAIAMYAECVQNYRLCGYRSSLAWSLYCWGLALLQEGDAIQARALFKESLTIFSELRDGPGQESFLLGMAGTVALAGQDELAARLFGADQSISEKLGSKMGDLDHKVFDPFIATIRERLGETKFMALWAESRKLTFEQALELAQAN
jgi:predicted ATPase/DNA-binding SARP family transcriptional activator